ncbi:MAG: glycosyltransferase family 39 protein [Deltaproteobacteria bacterium]|nr:glycosyltransferase family 39 protein [Deltaproteobacteria bacterium]MBW1819708.1 glycosyltransferase family 39 protein [Deltaproteobacteria bacterium]
MSFFIKNRFWDLFILMAPVLFLALFLNFYNIDFSSGYHNDEGKKFIFVKNMDQDFHHPVLMLQIARFFNGMLHPSDDTRFIVMCRAVSALSGMLIVFMFFHLANTHLGRVASILAAVGLAASPIMVVHAHYFKEDMVFTLCAMLSLWALLRFLRDQGMLSTLLLGAASGLALSAQYKGMLLFPLILAAPFIIHVQRKNAYYAKFPIVLMVSILVFLVVNYPIFIDPDGFFLGLSHQARHAVKGHILHIDPLSWFFSFHLAKSIAPGISWPLTLLSLAGFAWMLRKWRNLNATDRVFLLYFVLFYFVHELSRLKPYPDYGRYMIPVIPAMFYFIAFLARDLLAAGRPIILKSITVVGIAAMICYVLYDSVLLDYHIVRDTRAEAERLVRLSGKSAVFEKYAVAGKGNIRYLAYLDVDEEREKGVRWLIASSFTYDRFYMDNIMEHQLSHIDHRKYQYDAFFSFPYEEIRPAHRTYAFSNPVIRLIDIGAK